ncbi:unnamed protein product [Rhodiola kirilowii]
MRLPRRFVLFFSHSVFAPGLSRPRAAGATKFRTGFSSTSDQLIGRRLTCFGGMVAYFDVDVAAYGDLGIIVSL